MTKSRFGASLVLTLTVFSSFAVLSAHAQTDPAEAAPIHPALNDRFIFGLGAFYSRSSTQAGLSGSAGGVGATVDFEKVLGLDERNVSTNGGFVWRMTERWRLEADYFSLNRDATRKLGSEVR